MNRVISFFEAQHGIRNDLSYDFALPRLVVAKQDSWRGIIPSNYSSDYNPEPPIFSAKFANNQNYRHILAIANEDGKIALQDTTVRNYEPEEKALTAPQCHFNAVFDLEWAPGQMKFVSASGDHTARLWDVVESDIRLSRIFNGHTRSVKTAAFRKNDPSVFATGGRDGAILIWDTRANFNLSLNPRADNCIYSGHSGIPPTPVSVRKKSRAPKLAQTPTISSITGLVFQDSTTLISCGAGDGIIKVWDMRRNYTCYKKEPQPKYSLPYAGSSTFKGFTNLLIDDSGTRLYANCMDNSIYCYDVLSYSPKPIQVYRGLRNSTFYIKSALSPDGKYLISGSSDEKAYIWNVEYCDPRVVLLGHTVEVTCVAWGAYGDMPIVTCSDDARHKIWRIGPEVIDQNDSINYKGYAERYINADKSSEPNCKFKYVLEDLESTPRALKRLINKNEKTPTFEEKVSTKRPLSDILEENNVYCQGLENEPKRPKISESKGRRLFSPASSRLHFICDEHNETEQLGPMRELEDSSCRTICNNGESVTSHTTPNTNKNALGLLKPMPPLESSSCCGAKLDIEDGIRPSSILFSPTSNLPNYVLDGDAPHLSIMSPQQNTKDKVDWLTKIRKQKLMSRIVTLPEKIPDKLLSEGDSLICSENPLLSPRIQSLHTYEGSPKVKSLPKRRLSHSHTNNQMSPSSPCPGNLTAPRTPTSSRRYSETSILRFFSMVRRSREELDENLHRKQSEEIAPTQSMTHQEAT